MRSSPQDLGGLPFTASLDNDRPAGVCPDAPSSSFTIYSAFSCVGRVSRAAACSPVHNRVSSAQPRYQPEAKWPPGGTEPDQGPPEPLSLRRTRTDEYTAKAKAAWSLLCPNQLVEDKIAGVPVRIVTPEGLPEANRDKVLLNLHGGGFNSDSGSYTESIPIAGYTKIKVVAVLYRLAPEHPFPAAVDDSVAVYKELLK